MTYLVDRGMIAIVVWRERYNISRETGGGRAKWNQSKGEKEKGRGRVQADIGRVFKAVM